MTKEKGLFDRIREREPNVDRIHAALRQFTAGEPVTQRTVDTNEPIVVMRDDFLGVIYVSAGKRVLTRLSYKPNFDLDPERATRVSTFHDPQTGETIGPRQPEPRGPDKVSTDRSSSG